MLTLNQWFLTGGHASPGDVSKFPGGRWPLTRSTAWKVFERESVPSNYLFKVRELETK